MANALVNPYSPAPPHLCSPAFCFTFHVFIRLAAHLPIPSASICKSSSSFSLARRCFQAGLVAISSPTTRALLCSVASFRNSQFAIRN